MVKIDETKGKRKERNFILRERENGGKMKSYQQGVLLITWRSVVSGRLSVFWRWREMDSEGRKRGEEERVGIS